MIQSRWNTIDSFWLKVEKTDTCWIWLGKVHKATGKARFCINGKYEWIQRIVWRLIHGYIPGKKIVYCSCLNKLCVRPEHLKIKTRASLNKTKTKNFISSRDGRSIFMPEFLEIWNKSNSIKEVIDKTGFSRSFLNNARKQMRRHGYKIRALTLNKSDNWNKEWLIAEKKGLIGGRSENDKYRGDAGSSRRRYCQNRAIGLY